MFCSTGEVVFIRSDQVDKTCPSTLILASSQGKLLGYIIGYIKSIYPELALYGSKNECARTDTVLFPISQVCTRGETITYTQVDRQTDGDGVPMTDLAQRAKSVGKKITLNLEIINLEDFKIA